MPLAAEDDDVALFRLMERKTDGLAPVLDDGERRSALQKCGEHIAQDGVRVFGAGIVAREDNEVRERRGDAAHAGSLCPVAVSPAAKERDDAPVGKAADRGENIFEPVGRVRIVNDDGERCIKRYDLAPPLNADTFRQRFCRIGKRHAERLHGAERRERVIERKAAGDADFRLLVVEVGASGEAHAVVFVAGTPADKVIRHALPECNPLARKAGEQALRPRIVTVNAGDVTLVEKPRLRVAVGLHRAVVVKMILRQVRENTDAESDSFYPALHQRVGRNLHHGIGAARIDHLGEQALHGQRVGRCAVGRDGLVADQILIRADQADLCALRALQKLFDKIRRGRFAVCAGHADHGEFSRRSTIPYRRAKRKRFVRIRH